jgi:Fic family protein
MHKHMLKQGRSKIEEVGVRIYCTQIAKIYGVSENTARKDYSDLVKYGRL